MQSDLPKVLHPVAGRAMIHWVLDACEQAGVSRSVVVIGHQAERVRAELAARDRVSFVEQTEQLGTGHAVMQAEAAFSDFDGDVLVLCGDGPLIRPETLNQILKVHRETAAAATLATAILDDASGYGRIVRDEQGTFAAIVEDKDATAEQLKIKEVNPSYYCFDAESLFSALAKTDNHNAKGEYYITDVFSILRAADQTVSVIAAVPSEDIYSINTPSQLAEVDTILRDRLAGGSHSSHASTSSENAR